MKQQEPNSHLNKFIYLLLDDNFKNNVQYYNWCCWSEFKRTILLTDFHNNNREFNRFKKHIKKYCKGKVSFKKVQYNKHNYMNIEIKIKN